MLLTSHCLCTPIHWKTQVALITTNYVSSSCPGRGSVDSGETSVIDIRLEFWGMEEAVRLVSGLWRCRGRLHNTKIPYSMKFPILLSMNHPFTILAMQQAHEKVSHNGSKKTLTELTSRYWVHKGRSLVKQYINHRTICQKFEALSYCAPQPPPLLPFQVKEEPPFACTGVDFAGSFYNKADTQADKVWICLYTCCITRVIHLDLIPNISA